MSSDADARRQAMLEHIRDMTRFGPETAGLLLGDFLNDEDDPLDPEPTEQEVLELLQELEAEGLIRSYAQDARGMSRGGSGVPELDRGDEHIVWWQGVSARP
jgi:hypothetical protein